MFRGNFETELKIPGGGWGPQMKDLPGGTYGYFLKPHIFNVLKPLNNCTTGGYI